MAGALPWVLGTVLGLLCVLQLVVLSSSHHTDTCRSLHTLENSLNYSGRRTYMSLMVCLLSMLFELQKHYLPINYTIAVHYEEVFRVSNLSRLNSTVPHKDLESFWLFVSKEVLKKILRVLPTEHPSWRYVADLEELFRKIEDEFSKQLSQSWWLGEMQRRVKESKETKCVKPKALLDNCFRTMKCLFSYCFDFKTFPCKPFSNGTTALCSFPDPCTRGLKIKKSGEGRRGSDHTTSRPSCSSVCPTP
ncbi:interleukin-34 isoform X2 [Lepisosteus oculatus]|uniref:interleukin-34 isoform X2 n=1 Tax=Lepisosteus oculatus TaxID=7918 RepID=UPI0035F50EBF